MTLTRIVIPAIAVLCALNSYCDAQPNDSITSIDRLRGLDQTAEIMSFYAGLFDKVGVMVVDRNYQFTISQSESGLSFHDRLDTAQVDFIVRLDQQNLENLISFTKDGTYDDLEASRITAVLFSPFTKVNLMNEVTSSQLKERVTGLEDLMHIHLTHPNGRIIREYSIAYVPEEWVIMDGLQGEPHREFTLSYEPALEFHRRLFLATKADTKKEWVRFFRWYRSWKNDYSIAFTD